jgi:hypothetical protein
LDERVRRLALLAGERSLQEPEIRHRTPTLSILIAVVVFLYGAADAVAQPSQKVVHVFVALADNAHQGIVPVPAVLGNGDDPARNLYWGAAFGVRTYFRQDNEWKEIAVIENANPFVLERSVFFHAGSDTYLIADAYRGREIKQAISDFFQAAAGLDPDIGEIKTKETGKIVRLTSKPALLVYVGHDGLMDFTLAKSVQGTDVERRQAIILACASKSFFASGLLRTGAQPLLWTTGLMAPEAYTLKAALDGWTAGESAQEIRTRAASAYAKYQKCGSTAA